MSKIFIIGSVRDATEETRKAMEEHVRVLEEAGNEVHLPHRDTNQEATGIEICRQNAKAIEEADEVHIFYDPDSDGSHFDLGVAWALNKKLVVVSNVPYGEGKSYPRMIDEWQEESRPHRSLFQRCAHRKLFERAMVVLQRKTDLLEITLAV